MIGVALPQDLRETCADHGRTAVSGPGRSPGPLGVGLLVGQTRRSYRLQAEQSAALLAQVEQLRAEQRQVAVLNERTRIAREIRDVLAHSLGALGIQIQAARGMTNAEITQTLVLSNHTIKTHINRIFAKTGSANRTEASRFARAHGLT